MKLENRTLYFGDNLDILREKFPDESIDLVYLDPPFFTQTDWTKNRNTFGDKWKDMNEYINFMSLRLKELHRVLKPTGTIYLHCDWHASHYLKIEMDKIFGYNKFRNEIIWHYTKMNNSTKSWISNSDSVFFYTKSDEYTFNIQYSDEGSALYERFSDLIDEDNKLRWLKVKTMKQQLLNSYVSSAKKRKGKELEDDDVIIDFKNKGKKKYDNVWHIPLLKGNSDEYLGYPTQKPEEILIKIISASSNPGDIVLDPFCGSGTTCVVAKKLGRNYIGIDSSQDAINLAEKRLKNTESKQKSLFED